jgi:hypothetical protein
MIFTQQHIETARENWIKASGILNFKIITPYFILVNGNAKEVFMFLPEYGSRNGLIADLIFPPEFEIDKEIRAWAKENKCFCSFMYIEGQLSYNEKDIQDALDDWMKYDKPLRKA